MIVNPSTAGSLSIISGRMLAETFGLIGETIKDAGNPRRLWSITGFYAPLNMAISGIRARLQDQKDFIAFVNQRDLEVLLGIGIPGEYCAWLGEDYVSTFDRSWLGICTDTEDLEDDLFGREAELRNLQTEITGSPLLPTGLEITRRVCLNENTDCEELHYLRGDFNNETGTYPDLRFQTLTERWIRVERRSMVWRQT